MIKVSQVVVASGPIPQGGRRNRPTFENGPVTQRNGSHQATKPPNEHGDDHHSWPNMIPVSCWLPKFSLVLWLVIWLMPEPGRGQNWLMEYLLPDDYDNEIPPIIRGEVYVNLTIQIHTFRIVHDEQAFRTDLDLCMTWIDPRFQTLNITADTPELPVWAANFTGTYEKITTTHVERLWYPEVYFRNSMSTQITQSLEPIQYAEIWPETKMAHMCTRYRVYFTCLLNLSNFPFDQNHCYFEVENIQRYRLRMNWIKSPDGNSQVRVMHRFVGNCQAIGFNTFTLTYDPRHMNTVFNNQSCVYGALRFVRHINYYIIRYYTNTFLCMCISCIGPWITILAYPGRTILTATVLFAVIRISHTGYDEVPARDVVSLYWWFWCVQFFIYACLCEYAFAIAWRHFAMEKNKAHATGTESPDGHYFGKNGWYKKGGQLMQRFLHYCFGPIDFAASPLHRNKVDYFARIFLPSLMFLWVMVYLIATVSPWATKYRYY